MAQTGKFTSLKGKAQKDTSNGKKWKVLKSDSPQNNEVDVEIEVLDTDTYQVERLSLPVPTANNPLTFGGEQVRWFTNFSVKDKNGKYVTKAYKVNIPGLKILLGRSTLVILDQNGAVVAVPSKDLNLDQDSFTLYNGDPAPGMAP